METEDGSGTAGDKPAVTADNMPRGSDEAKPTKQTASRPRTLKQTAAAPKDLTGLDQWILWRYEHRTQGAKPDKVPCDPHTNRLLRAWQKDSSAWHTYEDAVTLYKANPALAGIGFVLTADIELIGIDMDHAIDLETGEVAEWATEHVRDFDSYTEVSPSGTGFRIFVHGVLPDGSPNRSGHREIYTQGRWLTFTGNVFNDMPVMDCSAPALSRYLSAMRPPKTPGASPQLTAAVRNTELIRVLMAGENLHDSTRDLAFRLIADGMTPPKVIAHVRSLMEAMPDRGEPTRWQARYDDIARLVRDAAVKLAAGVNTSTTATDIAVNQRGFKFRSARDLVADRTSARWLIRDWFELCALVLVFGDAASCKTWLAIGLALHVATGAPWFGAPVLQGAVFIIAGEGFQGLRRRIAGMALHYRIDLDGLPLFVSDTAASFTEKESIADVITAIRVLAEQCGRLPVLVIVDTLARNFGPGDENSTQDMGAFVRLCDWVRIEFGCTVMILHHVGHGDKTRARGNTTLRGALDVEYRVLKDEAGIVSVECTKAKDFDAPESRRYTLQNVPLPWIDEDGNAVHSAALVSTDALPVVKGVAGRGKNQTIALRVLRDAYTAARSRLESSAHDPDGARVRVDEWKDRCRAEGLERNRFDEVRRGLEQGGHVRCEGPHVMISEVA